MDLTVAQALAAAVLGGIGSKMWDVIRDRVRSRAKDSSSVKIAQIEDLATIRAELWAEINELRERIDAMQGELDIGRRKYAELLLEHIDLKGRHNQLERDHALLQGKYEIVKQELDQIRDQRL